MSRLLLCSDLDRTLLPNGVQSESPDARRRFAAFCAHPGVELVFVTGRHRSLVEQAMHIYRLPNPGWCVTDVGTRIYQIQGHQWQESEAWREEIAGAWDGRNARQLQSLLVGMEGLTLQENSKQSDYKLSFYVPLQIDRQSLFSRMEQRLEEAGIAASLIWSIDEPKGIGLLDVLPANATKLHAVEFLRGQLGYDMGQTLFAGDSGNDLPVMASALPSVLVANASEAIRRQARAMAERRGNGDWLYLADGSHLNMNGNYAAGVLEGVWHFRPEWRDWLEETHHDRQA